MATGAPTGTYEFFDHMADVGIQIQAGSLEELFRTAGRALMEWMGPPPEVGPHIEVEVHVEAEDSEELLVRWLQELLFLFHQRHAYLMEVPSISLQGWTMDATLVSRQWDESIAGRFQEVKAITYHMLNVSCEGSLWCACVILDI